MIAIRRPGASALQQTCSSTWLSGDVTYRYVLRCQAAAVTEYRIVLDGRTVTRPLCARCAQHQAAA